MKKCIDILPSLTKLVNLSLQNSILPNPFKQAVVTPLLKKSTLSKEDLKSYRPMIGLSFLSKLVEHVVAAQIRSHRNCLVLHQKLRFIYLCPRACLQQWCCSTCPQSSVLSIITHSFPVCQLGLALVVLF